MDNYSQPTPPASRWQFSLRTIFVVFFLTAVMLSLFLRGGGEVLTHVLVIGLLVGGAISLWGSNKMGKTPLVVVCAAVSGALTAANLAVFCTGFYIENYIKGGPWREIMWFSFVGAMLGALAGAAGRRMTNHSTEAADDRETGE